MTLSKNIILGMAIASASFATACTAHSGEAVGHNKTNANTYQKPGAAITYSHNLKSQLSAGENTAFKLTLTEHYEVGQLSVKLSADGDITLFSSSTEVQFDMSDGADHEMTISFTAQSNGRHYINVQALAVNPSGQPRPRIFSIPVQVGPAVAQKPNPDMKTLKNGENIIEMEAQEEIK